MNAHRQNFTPAAAQPDSLLRQAGVLAACALVVGLCALAAFQFAAQAAPQPQAAAAFEPLGDIRLEQVRNQAFEAGMRTALATRHCPAFSGGMPVLGAVSQ